jgi:DNA polymerase I-like protein with 3'-5' exonuclease and polymerase domains
MHKLPEFLTNPDPSIYYSDNWVCLDFETTNIEKGHPLNDANRIVLAGWMDQDGTHTHRAGELDQRELVAACNRADFLIAHNAKFELQWLDRCGYDVGSRPVWCTMVGEWVLAGNRPWGIFPSLDDCLARRGLPSKGQLVSQMIKAGVCPSDIPESLLLDYCVDDVIGTVRLFEAQRQSMDPAFTKLLNVMYTRCLVTPVLADIEKNGLHLDTERVEKEYEETLAKYSDVMSKLDDITGGINPNSPPQMAHFVYGTLGFEEKRDRKGNPIRNKPTKQFPDGIPIVKIEVLLSLKAKTKEQKQFLELKQEQSKLHSALSKNLSMFVGAVREHDGLFYGSINQCKTVTHRLASSGRSTYYQMFDDFKGCQFQNLPRAYKRLFSAREDGWEIGEADYAQLEFGTAGHVGNDSVIRKEVREGYDVHTYTRDVINSVDKKDIDRTGAKKHTFKPLYGGQSGTRGEKAYYQAFGDKYSELKETQDGWCIEVEAKKVLETEWGMRFYWPHARYGRDGWLNVKTHVFNTPIQSLATADIVPIGLVYLWHRTRDDEMFLINTVHDSVEAEFPQHERELFHERVKQAFLDDVYKYLNDVYDLQFSVPLGVEIITGDFWGELPEGRDEFELKMENPYYE